MRDARPRNDDARGARVLTTSASPIVSSIAVWRQLDVFELVIALLVPIPLALLGWVLTITAGIGALFLAVPFTALGAFMIYRAVVRQKHFVRVVGRWGGIRIRFDRPGWKRERFHAELLRRAGLPQAPIP